MSKSPLDGIRIIAVEQYGAGPYGSSYLADMGAEVIKIENPDIGGDVSRHTGPFFLGENDSHFFQTFNRNKKSLTLNLKLEEGRKVFEKLVKTADAVMNNLRGDQPAKLGIDYDTLKALNPKIVCAHLSAYGRDNDRASWPGYDYLMQAETGLMALTGEPDMPPSRFGLSMVDFMTGVTTVAGLLAAVLGAHRTGQGCDVDVSLFDVALHQLTYPATWYLNEQHKTVRMPRSAHPTTVPCQLYKTSDGWIFVAAMTPKFWSLLLKGLERADIGEDPRFADVAARRENREALTEVLDEVFGARTTECWLAVFLGRVPVAPIYEMDRALQSGFVDRIGMIQSVPHAKDPNFKALANPIRLDGQRLPSKPCSSLGQDTETILRSLGYNGAEIDSLKAVKAV